MFLAAPHGLWNLSSPTRDLNPWLAVKAWNHEVLTTGPSRNSLEFCIFIINLTYPLTCFTYFFLYEDNGDNFLHICF